MNVLKPPKKYFERLENKKLECIKEDEKIENCEFENEKYSELYEKSIEFEKCILKNIVLQNSTLEKFMFRNVIFENCDFSNTNFIQNAFLKCEFKACKLTGSDFLENRFCHVTMSQTNADYSNMSLASIENILFQDMQMRNFYFQETKMKKIYFEKVDLGGAQFFKTSLYGVDLSSCNIEKIAISIEDIKGATIEQFQAIDLLYLLGVKVK